MARPRRIGELAEKARVMHGQLSEAYRILAGLRSCLEKLASLEVDPVYARLEASRKTTPYGDYEYPVLRLCQSPSDPSTSCRGYHVTRFQGFGEAFRAAADASVALAELREATRRALRILEVLEDLLKRLDKETTKIEEYVKRLQKPKEVIEEVVPVG